MFVLVEVLKLILFACKRRLKERGVEWLRAVKVSVLILHKSTVHCFLFYTIYTICNKCVSLL